MLYEGHLAELSSTFYGPYNLSEWAEIDVPQNTFGSAFLSHKSPVVEGIIYSLPILTGFHGSYSRLGASGCKIGVSLLQHTSSPLPTDFSSELFGGKKSDDEFLTGRSPNYHCSAYDRHFV